MTNRFGIRVASAALALATCVVGGAPAGAAAAAAGARAASLAPDAMPCATAPAPSPAMDALLAKFLEPGRVGPEEIAAFVARREVVEANRARAEHEKRDWAYLCRYRKENAALANGPPPTAVFLGDSITEFWVLGDPSLFTEGRIGRGIGGQTSPQLLVRFAQDVVALRPRVVHLMVGTNDIAGNTGPTSDDDYRNTIRAMLDLASANGIGVVLAGIPPSRSLFWAKVDPRARIDVLNRWLAEEAQRRGLAFVDYGRVLRAPDGGLLDALANDGVHPNRVGYERMRPLAIAALDEALKRAAAARPAIRVSDDGTVSVPAQDVPMSPYLSPQAKRYVTEHLHAMQDPAQLVQENGLPRFMRGILERQRALFPVERVERTIGGVPVYDYAPRSGIARENRDRVLIDLHGGGFSGCWPACAELESMPLAAGGRIRVVAVNYRQGPAHRHPAASEDVAAVYRELLRTYRSENVGIYGCSAGGMLTAMSVAWFQTHGLPRPGAIGIFCAGAGSPRGLSIFDGDAAYTAGPLGEARFATPGAAPPPLDYFQGTDPADPLVSPVNSPVVLAKFPPTLIVTGTRGFELSSSLHTHAQLVKAGVDARLHVWEGLFHGFFYDADVPESQDAHRVMIDFFAKNLGTRRARADARVQPPTGGGS